MIGQLAKNCLRSCATIKPAMSIARSVSALPKFVRLPTLSKGLSTTSFKLNAALEKALVDELEYEKENTDTETPSFVQNFEKSSGFKVVDTMGNKEVVLSRTVGGEKIDIYVNILAMENDSMADIDEEAKEDADAEEGEEGDISIPAVVTVQKVSNPEMGGLQFEVTIENGAVFIDSALYFKDSALVNADSSAAEWARESLYGGPVFSELDENLQDLFHQYLEERGCDASLGKFLELYLDHKEQKEYMNWLAEVQTFVKSSV